MITRFREEFDLPIGEVYSYFRTPADWTRLYGLAGEVKEYADDWYAIPLRGFPFPLIAKNTEQEPYERVRWVFRGFWRGGGEVRFAERSGKVVIEGYEAIAVRWLFCLSPVIERLFLERRFLGIWNLGWQRLRKRAARE